MSFRAWIYRQHLLYFLGISHSLVFTVISERINTKEQSLCGVIVLFCPGSTKNKYCCSEVSQSYLSKGANFPLLPLSNLKKGTKKNMIQNTNTLYHRSPELDGAFQTKDATGWHEWTIVQILQKRFCQTLKPSVVILVRLVATLDLSHSPHPAITTSVNRPHQGDSCTVHSFMALLKYDGVMMGSKGQRPFTNVVFIKSPLIEIQPYCQRRSRSLRRTAWSFWIENIDFCSLVCTVMAEWLISHTLIFIALVLCTTKLSCNTL